MNYLSLFSGVGGGDLAFQHLIKPKWRCVGYVEFEKYCQKVIRQRQEASDVDRFAKEVMAEIDRDFKVDWAKDSKKIVDEMRMFSDDFKRNDPKGAALKAIQLAGVSCEKRPNPLDLPFLESSGSYNQMRTKALETEKEKYLSGFREAAKEANTAPLSGLWD